MDEIAKQLTDALDKDFSPGSKLAHKPIGNSGEPDGKPARGPTTTEQINATIAEFQALIRVLEKVRDRL